MADRVIFDLGLVRELGYYTGAVFEVYDPAVGFALGGGGRYDDLIGRFGRDAARLRHRARRAARARGPGRRGGLRMSDRLTIAVPRGALFDGHARPARADSASTPSEVRSNDRKLLFAERRHRDDAPERRAHLRGARLRGHRDHRQGRAARAGASARSTSCSTSATGSCRMVVAQRRRRRRDRRVAAPARRGPDRHQVPADRRASTSPSTGRQVEIVEVKGSVELAPLTGLVDGIVDLTATGTHAGARTTSRWWRRSASARRA